MVRSRRCHGGSLFDSLVMSLSQSNASMNSFDCHGPIGDEKDNEPIVFGVVCLFVCLFVCLKKKERKKERKKEDETHRRFRSWGGR